MASDAKVMKVFLSWSGEISHRVACALHDWIPSVLPFVEPWLSSEDIDKGARWSTAIAAQLDAIEFGIICVVPDNLAEPWLNFEAGAISKSLEVARVAPLLVGVNRSEVRGPLAQFQSTLFEREDVRRLLRSINKAAGSPVLADHLDRTFDLRWPGLQSKLALLDLTPPSLAESSPGERSQRELPDPQVQVLQLIAKHGDYELNAEKIAVLMKENRTKTQYHLDQLVSDGLLLDPPSYTGPTTYGLTESARAFLVERGLV